MEVKAPGDSCGWVVPKVPLHTDIGTLTLFGSNTGFLVKP